MDLLEKIFDQDLSFILADGEKEIFQSIAEKSVNNKQKSSLVDGAKASTKSDLMEEFYTKLDFPEHFGRNWDALYDSLTDFLWSLDEDKYLLLFTNADQLLSKEKDNELSNFLEILKMTAENVSQVDCDLDMKVIFLLKATESSHLKTAMLNNGINALSIR
jgi:hypothetical protein